MGKVRSTLNEKINIIIILLVLFVFLAAPASASPYIEFYSLDISDFGEHRDGYINNNEIVEIDVGIENTGTSDASYVKGKLNLKYPNPYITITDSSANYRDVAKGDKKYDTFKFEVGNVPKDSKYEKITFELVLTDSSGNTWTEWFTKYVTVLGEPEPTTYALTTKVYDSISGDAISGARVYLDGASKGYTSSSGLYKITGVSEGDHNVKVTKSDYKDVTMEINDLNSDKTLTFNIHEIIPQYTLTVKVVDSVSGDAISGARVYLDGVPKGYTSDSGSLKIYFVSKGEHNVKVTKSGSPDVTKSVYVSSYITTTLTIDVPEPTYTLTVKAVDSSSNAVSDARVYLDDVSKGYTSDSGSLKIVGVSKGDHHVKVTKSGYSDEKSVYVSSDKTTTLTIPYVPPITDDPELTYTLTVKSVDSSSNAVSDARVYLDGVSKGYTSDSGSLKIVGVSKGDHHVKVTKSGYSDEKSVYVSSDKTTTLTIPYVPPITDDPELTYALTVKVVDFRTGDVVTDASVYLDDKYEGKTSSYGSLKISDVSEGKHEIKVIKDEYFDGSESKYVNYDDSISINILANLYTPNIKVYDSATNKVIEGADVYFDGKYKGTTSSYGILKISGVSEGSYNVKIKKNGYRDVSSNVFVDRKLIQEVIKISPNEMFVSLSKNEGDVPLRYEKRDYWYDRQNEKYYDENKKEVVDANVVRQLTYLINLNSLNENSEIKSHFNTKYIYWQQISDDFRNSYILSRISAGLFIAAEVPLDVKSAAIKFGEFTFETYGQTADENVFIVGSYILSGAGTDGDVRGIVKNYKNYKAINDYQKLGDVAIDEFGDGNLNKFAEFMTKHKEYDGIKVGAIEGMAGAGATLIETVVRNNAETMEEKALNEMTQAQYLATTAQIISEEFDKIDKKSDLGYEPEQVMIRIYDYYDKQTQYFLFESMFVKINLNDAKNEFESTKSMYDSTPAYSVVTRIKLWLIMQKLKDGIDNLEESNNRWSDKILISLDNGKQIKSRYLILEKEVTLYNSRQNSIPLESTKFDLKFS